MLPQSPSALRADRQRRPDSATATNPVPALQPTRAVAGGKGPRLLPATKSRNLASAPARTTSRHPLLLLTGQRFTTTRRLAGSIGFHTICASGLAANGSEPAARRSCLPVFARSRRACHQAAPNGIGMALAAPRSRWSGSCHMARQGQCQQRPGRVLGNRSRGGCGLP